MNDLFDRAATVDMISYDTGATTGTLRLSMGAPSVNQSVNFGTAATENSKDYAIGVEIAQSKSDIRILYLYKVYRWRVDHWFRPF